jgi:nitroreductase
MAFSFPVVEAVRQRRTVYRFRPAPLPDGLLEELLAAARFSPNHKHSEPWRFVVVRGDALGGLADLRVELQRERAARDGKPVGNVDALRAEVAEAAAAVYVLQVAADDPVRRREDYASCAIAAYILQLAAWERGIGARWNTGQITRGEKVRGFLGLSEGEEVVCCLLLGYPAEVPADWLHRPVQEVTRYIE